MKTESSYKTYTYYLLLISKTSTVVHLKLFLKLLPDPPSFQRHVWCFGWSITLRNSCRRRTSLWSFCLHEVSDDSSVVSFLCFARSGECAFQPHKATSQCRFFPLCSDKAVDELAWSRHHLLQSRLSSTRVRNLLCFALLTTIHTIKLPTLHCWTLISNVQFSPKILES